jgi:hypothetical protein
MMELFSSKNFTFCLPKYFCIPLMQPESLVFVVKNKYIFFEEDELKDNVQLVNRMTGRHLFTVPRRGPHLRIKPCQGHPQSETRKGVREVGVSMEKEWGGGERETTRSKKISNTPENKMPPSL